MSFFQVDQVYTPDDFDLERRRKSVRFTSSEEGLGVLDAALRALGFGDAIIEDVLATAEAELDADEIENARPNGLLHTYIDNDGTYDWHIVPNPEDSPDQVTLTLTERNYLSEVGDSLDLRADDLYTALHHVGDDPVKAEIQETLKQILSPDAYRKVVATFLIATDIEDEHSDELARRTYPERVRRLRSAFVQLQTDFQVEEIEGAMDEVGVSGPEDFDAVYSLDEVLHAAEHSSCSGALETWLTEGGHAL